MLALSAAYIVAPLSTKVPSQSKTAKRFTAASLCLAIRARAARPFEPAAAPSPGLRFCDPSATPTPAAQ
jgi:hypothetical protein